MMCPRDCFFCLKRILIFIYNTYYKNIYIIYSIYTLVILEFWIGFLPSGLTRRPSGCRDGIQYEARRHTPSSVVNRTRAKLIFSHRVWPDGFRVVETGFSMKPVGILRVRSSTERGRSWFSPIGFDPMAFGLSRRDSVRSPSAYSELGLNRARAKLIFSHRVWPDGRRVVETGFGKKPVGILWARSQPSEGEAGFLHRVRLDGRRVGRWANGEKGNGRVRRHGDVCKLAEGVLCLPKQ